jgi:uncharacterized membrane protein YfcA
VAAGGARTVVQRSLAVLVPPKMIVNTSALESTPQALSSALRRAKRGAGGCVKTMEEEEEEENGGRRQLMVPPNN